ncbi:hypothetical protein [Caryophanon tenue]|uniref:Uncharacterized protein n=1 Tax=Caryophanon tenue TaxID=33978 RepID=A0A1C0YDI4_9BACL|nr:hypothetical protein [Caryophanon tenue]OCS85194.1 hypothetical protein A6M13_13695 [Caryophanon tenue]
MKPHHKNRSRAYARHQRQRVIQRKTKIAIKNTTGFQINQDAMLKEKYIVLAIGVAIKHAHMAIPIATLCSFYAWTNKYAIILMMIIK